MANTAPSACTTACDSGPGISGNFQVWPFLVTVAFNVTGFTNNIWGGSNALPTTSGLRGLLLGGGIISRDSLRPKPACLEDPGLGLVLSAPEEDPAMEPDLGACMEDPGCCSVLASEEDPAMEPDLGACMEDPGCCSVLASEEDPAMEPDLGACMEDPGCCSVLAPEEDPAMEPDLGACLEKPAMEPDRRTFSEDPRCCAVVSSCAAVRSSQKASQGTPPCPASRAIF